jgi:anti-anti-sigma factor
MVRPIRAEIREETSGEHVTLTIEGELDLGSVPLLAQQIEAQTDSGETKVVTLDLSDVTFMDSSGLRMLIEVNDRAQREAWRLSLIAPKHEAARLVLRMTGADGALPFESRPES